MLYEVITKGIGARHGIAVGIEIQIVGGSGEQFLLEGQAESRIVLIENVGFRTDRHSSQPENGSV